MGTRGQSIRKVLEDKDYQKVWWDARTDSNALFYHHQILLSNVMDLQVMEIAICLSCKKWRHSLGKVVPVEGYACGRMTAEKAASFAEVNVEGKRFFKTNQDGYGVFDQRPLSALCVKYAGQDTAYMPLLYEVYQKRMANDATLMALVVKESKLAVKAGWNKTWKGSNMQNSRSPASLQALDYDDFDDY